eukprot:scaffold13861_cov79-Isochrysis_galbana.AAC.2
MDSARGAIVEGQRCPAEGLLVGGGPALQYRAGAWEANKRSSASSTLWVVLSRPTWPQPKIRSQPPAPQLNSPPPVCPYIPPARAAAPRGQRSSPAAVHTSASPPPAPEPSLHAP